MREAPPRDVPESISEAVAAVEPPDRVWEERAAARQARLTMPPGSLGRLLELGCQLAAVQRTDQPVVGRALVAVFAADHGVAASGVSAYPQEVTGQMVANFLRGGAAVTVLTRRMQAEIVVVDLGVAHPVEGLEQRGYFRKPIRRGTSNFLAGPAMSREEAFCAFQIGLNLAEFTLGTGGSGPRVVGLGEMGIGNTTTAAALIAALTGASPARVVGRGTGVDDAGLARKRAAVERALALHAPDGHDLWDWLARVGGFEILGLAGLAIGAAARRSLVVLDGLISSTAGLIAARLCPNVRGSLVAAHLSPEPGHRVVLDELGLRPLLDLGLRLGEGTGATLALPLITSAADILRDMATFESAGVSGAVAPARSVDSRSIASAHGFDGTKTPFGVP